MNIPVDPSGYSRAPDKGIFIRTRLEFPTNAIFYTPYIDPLRGTMLGCGV